MTHKKHPQPPLRFGKPLDQGPTRKLEITLKCDSVGSVEAVMASLTALKTHNVTLSIIHSGVGPISKGDLSMALTGSRLVVGFDVAVLPDIHHLAQAQGIEVRLYDVIYKLLDDLRQTAESLQSFEAEEKITGKARVIALFKSSRKGIILGCEVQDGVLGQGNPFRVITAMGPVYTGRIESLQIETKPVKEARAGQQVGLKIADFNAVKLGDFIECFTTTRPKAAPAWKPKPGVFHLSA
jgi:translation initiation factor IF-2